MEQIFKKILEPIGGGNIKECRVFDPDFPSLRLIKRETIITSKVDNYMLYDIETGQYIDTLIPLFKTYYDSYQDASKHRAYDYVIYNQKQKIITYAVVNTSRNPWNISIENYKVTYINNVFKCELIAKYESNRTSLFSVLPSSELYMLYNRNSYESFPHDQHESDIIILDSKTLQEIRKFENMFLISPSAPDTIYAIDMKKTYLNNSVIALETNSDIPDIIFYNYKSDIVLSHVINKANVSEEERQTRKDNVTGDWIKYQHAMKYSMLQDVKGNSMIKIYNNKNNKYINIMDSIKDEQCCVCFDITKRTKTLVPCGHSQFCLNCISMIKDCPMCRTKVTLIIPRY